MESSRSPAADEPASARKPDAGRQQIPSAGGAPTHLAVVLDGNRRWAAARGLSPAEGYEEGARRFFELVGWSEEAGVDTLTVWALSADNLRRPQNELAGLLAVITEVVESLIAHGHRRIRHLGRGETLPSSLRTVFEQAVAATSAAAGMTVNIAVGYDGRAEIADAVHALVSDLGCQTAAPALRRDWEQLITERLYTCGQPDPDLIIRTSGEQRLSGFLLWQSVWSEYYFSDIPWPAFTRQDFDLALESYARRQRRFGQ
ncbi:polyprenyl diphosphate synthase [Streptomyces nojiriensis]|uniref:polyprenyl diphosphate synthase n=1 Tax=Streptomyces nojiriensis TaxID=66374 RepID=UPI0035E2F8A3